MANPMMKKNPMMSMWLSAANAWMGAGRGLWTAEIERWQRTMMTEATRQLVDFWTGAWMLRSMKTRDDKDRR